MRHDTGLYELEQHLFDTIGWTDEMQSFSRNSSAVADTLTLPVNRSEEIFIYIHKDYLNLFKFHH